MQHADLRPASLPALLIGRADGVEAPNCARDRAPQLQGLLGLETAPVVERKRPFDGRWCSDKGVFVATIKNKRILWDGGGGDHLQHLSGGEVSVCPGGGKAYRGKLDAEGRLVWSDGDHWIREATPCAVEAPRGASSGQCL